MPRGPTQPLFLVLRLLGAVAATLFAQEVAAQPLLLAEGSSLCPAPVELQGLIDQWSVRPRVDRRETWIAEVDRPDAGTARLRLRTPQGQTLLERSIGSVDCAALAQAFAIILEAHFLDLGLVEKTEVEQPPPASPPPPKAAISVKDRGHPVSTAWVRGWRLGGGLGTQWGLPDSGFTGAAQLFVAPVLARTWAFQLSAMTGLQQVQSQGRTNDRIESQALSVSLAIAKRQQLLENAWWEPRAGAGVRLSRAQ
ncbi:MAG: hypothetical protein RJA70_2457, partial [Pseudomonadota bacterium]